MRHTLVAAFDNTADADRARADLMSRGIARTHIHSVASDSAEIHGYDTPYTTSGGISDRNHHESKVAHFFKSLFGGTDEHHRRHAEVYPEAVRRGSSVLAVDVDDDDELAKVHDALEFSGAIDIDERSAGWTRDSGTTRTSGSGPSRAAMGAGDPIGAVGGTGRSGRPATVGETGTTAGVGRYSESERPGAGGPIGTAEGSGRTSEAYEGRSDSADTGRYGVGGAAKRAGTDYPPTTATTAPTGGGISGDGTRVGSSDVGRTSASDVGGEPAGLGSRERDTGALGGTSGTPGSSALGSRNTTTGERNIESSSHGTCSDRICVIRRTDDDSYPR